MVFLICIALLCAIFYFSWKFSKNNNSPKNNEENFKAVLKNFASQPISLAAIIFTSMMSYNQSHDAKFKQAAEQLLTALSKQGEFQSEVQHSQFDKPSNIILLRSVALHFGTRPVLHFTVESTQANINEALMISQSVCKRYNDPVLMLDSAAQNLNDQLNDYEKLRFFTLLEKIIADTELSQEQKYKSQFYLKRLKKHFNC